jgi:DNA (cytosine-5)-methyltransferase 1
MSSPNAIVLSERAAAILQGFPEDWLFAGATKKACWSQIGQAMPPPLAHAVARAVVDAMARADKTEAA